MTESVAQFHTTAAEPRHHRANWNHEHGADLFAGKPLDTKKQLRSHDVTMLDIPR